MREKIVILLVLGLIFRITFAFISPPFSGNDEKAHIVYSKHIFEEKRIPNAYLYKDESLKGNEYFQPPLYYLLTSPITGLYSNTITQLSIFRVFSIFMWALSFFFSYKILAFIKAPAWLSFGSLSFSALLPTYIANTATANNDALLILIFSITLFKILTLFKKKIHYQDLTYLAVLSALAILTKLNGLILAPAAMLLIFLQEKRLNYEVIKKTAFYFLLTGLFSGWWFIYNFILYKNFMGPIEFSTASFAKIPLSVYKIFLVTRGSFATFWLAYGSTNEIRLPLFVYMILFLLTIFSVIGLISYFRGRNKDLIKPQFLILFGVILICNIFLHLTFNIIQFQPLGRYLYPSLLPISVFFSIGVYQITPSALKKFLPEFLLLLFCSLNVWGVITLLGHY